MMKIDQRKGKYHAGILDFSISSTIQLMIKTLRLNNIRSRVKKKPDHSLISHRMSSKQAKQRLTANNGNFLRLFSLFMCNSNKQIAFMV